MADDPAPDDTTPPDCRGPDDPYARVGYRKLIAWKQRILREGPFLRTLLERAPDRSVLDVGCGTGEHTAFFAQEGARAVGLDRSETMIAAARDHQDDGHGRFLVGDALDARSALGDEPPFGLAICLGNMLPHVKEDADLAAFLRSVHDLLLPNGLLLIQLLNYERIVKHDVRALPVNVRPSEDGGEIVFLRLLEPAPDGRILFFPATLTIDKDPAAENPIAVQSSRRVELRAWTPADLAPRLVAAGFAPAFLGDMQGGDYDPDRSPDLVVVAMRA